MATVEKWGDWKKLDKLLSGDALLAHKIQLAVHKATIKNALLLVSEIKKGIKSQAPGGKAFAKLAESTIKKKGSSKALIDTSFLVNSITQKIMADKAFVGLLRGTRNKTGEEIVNIGAIMEYGATIKHPSGTVIIIPARPFIHPVMKKDRAEIEENYRKAIRSVFG
ncbi:MAG: hypothetical protein ACE5GM_10905 [bacterium]